MDDAGNDAGERLVAPQPSDQDAAEASLRPQTLDEFVGQRQLRDNLSIFMAAAKSRGEALDHVLFSGPPGLGKTTLAQIVARETGRRVPRHLRPGDPARRRPRGAAHQPAAARRPVHRRDPPADAGGRGNPLSGDGGFSARPDHRRGAGGALGADRPAALHPGRRDDALGPDHPAAARALRHPAAPRLLRAGRAGADRGARRAGCWGLRSTPTAPPRSPAAPRGTPRVAMRLLRRVRDFAAVQSWPSVDAAAADAALSRLDVDGRGLDAHGPPLSALHRRELRRRPGRGRDHGGGAWATSATSSRR